MVVSETGKWAAGTGDRERVPGLVKYDWLAQCLISGERLDWATFLWGSS